MGPMNVDVIASAGYASKGVGAPVFIGRNRTLALTLDVTELIEGTSPTLDVSIETAASQRAATWRTLGAFARASAVGSTALALTGADAFIRGRYAPSSGAGIAFGVSGVAALVLLPSTALAASGTTSSVDVAQYRAARLTLDVTALAGTTPKLTVTVETAASEAGTWRTVDTFPACTAVGQKALTVAGLDRLVRVRYVLSGAGATFTASVSGESVFCLASPADRDRLGIRGGTIPDVDSAQTIDALITATSIVLGYLAPFDLPLLAWGDDLRMACIAIADYLLVTNRGAEPARDSGASLYVVRYREYVGEPPQRNGWLDLVRRKEVRPSGLFDSTPPTADGKVERVTVRSLPRRGWGTGGGQ